MRRPHALPVSTDAIDWTFYEADDFNLSRLDIVLATAPTSAGVITVKKDSVDGAAFDTVLRTINPVGRTSISITGESGFISGDKIRVEYSNPDGVSFSASASVEIYSNISLLGSGLSADSGIIRSLNSNYRRYYHVDLGSSDPGGSGATFTASNSNHQAGMRLNSATEILRDNIDIHNDWDTSTSPVFEAKIFSMMDNSGGTVDDIIKFKFVMRYSQPSIPGMREQTFNAEAIVGQLQQYSHLEFEKEIDATVEDNEIYPGDTISVELNLESDSDINDVLISEASFYYQTTHIGIEEGDV